MARETLAILARLTPVSTEWTTDEERLVWGPRRNHGAGRWADCPNMFGAADLGAAGRGLSEVMI